METLPIIHTNIWDTIIAVPLVVILTQIIKKFSAIPKSYIPGIANLIGLVISIFFAHRKNFWVGVFMGFFYGNAAVGLYASIKTQLKAFKNKK